MSRRVALSLGAIVLGLIALGLFAWRPTPVVGVDGASLSYSIDTSFISTPCQPQGEGWRCPIWDSATSGTVDYLVEVDWAGCWDAERAGSPASEGGTPKHRSGCVNFFDHLRLWDRM